MCSVVVSCRGALWLLVGLLSLVMQLVGILSPAWLVAPPGADAYTPSVGLFSRCIKLDEKRHCASFAVDGFGTTPSTFPTAWKAALFLLVLCAVMHFFTLLAGVLSCCVQAVFRKSVISLAGAAQSFAGVLGVIGFLLHPWGWGAERVQHLCGDTQPFLPADCTIGMGLYASAAGVALTFAASALSRPADKAADSDKLERHIEEGRSLICIK